MSDAQYVKQLREENARLKKLVADLKLDKDMIRKKRAEVQRLREEFTTGERRVCELLEIPRLSIDTRAGPTTVRCASGC